MFRQRAERLTDEAKHDEEVAETLAESVDSLKRKFIYGIGSSNYWRRPLSDAVKGKQESRQDWQGKRKKRRESGNKGNTPRRKREKYHSKDEP
jgi:hypothetical protein